MIPALRFSGDGRRGIDESADDRLALEILQLEIVPALQRRVGVHQHVAVGVQHEDVRVAFPPATVGDAKVLERRFSPRADQFRRVVHERDKLARLLVLIELLRCGGAVRLAPDRSGLNSHKHLLVIDQLRSGPGIREMPESTFSSISASAAPSATRTGRRGSSAECRHPSGSPRNRSRRSAGRPPR